MDLNAIREGAILYHKPTKARVLVVRIAPRGNGRVRIRRLDDLDRPTGPIEPADARTLTPPGQPDNRPDSLSGPQDAMNRRVPGSTRQ